MWSTFDNATGVTAPIGETSGGTTTLEAPSGLPRTEGAFIKVDLSAIGSPHSSWAIPVAAYFRLRGGDWQLVGFDRMEER
jgi:hypothetical protein